MKLQHRKAMYPFQRCLLDVIDRVVLAMGHAPIAQVTSLLLLSQCSLLDHVVPIFFLTDFSLVYRRFSNPPIPSKMKDLSVNRWAIRSPEQRAMHSLGRIQNAADGGYRFRKILINIGITGDSWWNAGAISSHFLALRCSPLALYCHEYLAQACG